MFGLINAWAKLRLEFFHFRTLEIQFVQNCELLKEGRIPKIRIDNKSLLMIERVPSVPHPPQFNTSVPH